MQKYVYNINRKRETKIDILKSIDVSTDQCLKLVDSVYFIFIMTNIFNYLNYSAIQMYSYIL